MDLQKHHKATFDNISQEKRERIINAATNEFALKGFENANINNIAKKADVSVGSLYKYFENKQDLFLTIIHYSIASMEELLNTLLLSDEDILLKAEKIIRTIQKSSKENVLLLKLYNLMTSENNPRFASQFAYEMESMTARIYRLAIEQGKKNSAAVVIQEPVMNIFQGPIIVIKNMECDPAVLVVHGPKVIQITFFVLLNLLIVFRDR